MPRCREKQREKKRIEKMLGIRNEFGIIDTTPYQAVKSIGKSQKNLKKR